ncbi:MAG: GIY-YIG nuclease family protein [Gammaproteobacteria bacterium]|jgi:Uri superfamily endonuclease
MDEDWLERIPALPGTYVLVLESAMQGDLTVGRFGTLPMTAGYYLYVGSAFGPGGLRARLGHHACPPARPHWHVDYLRRATRLAEVWFSTAPERLEAAWAECLGQLPAAEVPLPGFGARDRRGATHLFRFSRRPGQLETVLRIGEAPLQHTAC